MSDLDIAAAEFAHEFDVVIAGHAECGAAGDGVHDETEDVGGFRTAVDEIAEEQEFAAGGDPDSGGGGIDLVAEIPEERDEFIVAAMDIADDVERTVVVAPVVPERLALDDGGVDFFRRLEDMNGPEALTLEPAERTFELLRLLPDDMCAEVAVGPNLVAVLGDALGEVEHDGDGKAVKLACELHERFAGIRLDIGGIDHDELACGKPFPRDEVEHFEGVAGGGLRVLVIGDEPAAIIRGEDFGGFEVAACERAFACAGDTDEHDEREIWND
ncbi:MAG: hypothetical protein DVB22_000317 [Verrucomicrobia bacterium]|nr:MAG: hypothetical protein DVB22_000317 [Verrucomicrobiota bacterium]